jgi:glycosyltransferase involved in cell wall biosynthesis
MKKTYEWENNKDTFIVIDVKKLYNNFFPAIKQKLSQLEVGKGLCVVQTFEPKPLISTVEEMGYEYLINKNSNHEFRLYIYNTGQEFDSKTGLPFKPYALLNYKFIDQVKDDQNFEFFDHNSFNILFYGKYTALHGVEYIIEAAKCLEKENLKFILVGSGLTIKKIRKTVEELALKNVVFVKKMNYKDLIACINDTILSGKCLKNYFT